MEQHPLVSIICESFNHEPFIRKCLDGFVMQQTSFPFEILIHDDASTDRSADIIREYEARFPNLLKPIYQTENQYSKGVGIWRTFQFPRAKGKYIALCEGDDYWTDPDKLQKQVDYMEAHPGCSLCFHNAMVHWYDKEIPDELYANFETGDFSGGRLIQNWISPTASFLFRSEHIQEYLDLRARHPQLAFGDIPLLMFLSQFGSIHGMSDVMSVYGKHIGGWTHSASAAKMYKDGRSWEELRAMFKPYKAITSDMVSKRYVNATVQSLKERNFSVFMKAFYRGFIRQPVRGVKALSTFIHDKRNKGSVNQGRLQ
ncbi:MAG: glycosyltransferase family 2 protein [Bacteroidales bacterium]|nr:glycosyltransferase family 2 protein [Bacteroidales bacterium]